MPGAALRIALTGGIASGKSTVAAVLRELGAAVIDSDAIARELTAPGGAAIAPIRAAFGEVMIDAQGALDRALMRARVFGDAGERRRLEAILHPMIAARSEELARAAQGRHPVIVFDIPLLVEGAPRSARARFDRVLVIDCPPARQLAFARGRATMSEEQVRAAMAAQAARGARLDAADDVIFNGGSLDALRDRARRLWLAWTAPGSARGL